MRKIIILYLVVLPGLMWSQTLEEYITMALENNPALKAKEAEYQAGVQKIFQARAIPDFELTADVVTRHMVYPEGNQLFGLTAMQMFPWFGKLEAMEAAAEQNALATRGEKEQTINNLIYQMRNAWHPWLELGALMRNKQVNLGILKADKEVATYRYQQGQSMLSEVIMTDLMIEEVQTEITLLEVKAKAAWADFAQWIGTPVPMPVMEVDALLTLPVPQDREIAGNPQLKVFDQKILAVEAEAVAIKKDQWPMIGAGVRYLPLWKRAGHDFHLEPNSGAQMIMPMIAVTFPLFGKRFKAGQKEMAFMQTAYREMKTDMVNQLRSEIEMVTFELEEADNMLTLYGRQLTKLNDALRLMMVEYQNNRIGLRDILQLRSQIFDLQAKQLKATTWHNQAIAKLFFIRGNNTSF